MGVSRGDFHKRTVRGGKRVSFRKSRKHDMGRQPSNTRLMADVRIRPVRVRGGNIKMRALRLNTGSFSWGSEALTRKTRILDVVYNATNNELVRTKTLVKSAIVVVDATPFRTFFEQKYGLALHRKSAAPVAAADVKELSAKNAAAVAANLIVPVAEGQVATSANVIAPELAEQLIAGRVLACITSRPGQTGSADGYLLEGPEYAFYAKKLKAKSRK